MVSAVFHAPLEKLPPAAPPQVREHPVAPARTVAANAAPAASPQASDRQPFDWRGVWLRVLPPIFGLGLLVGIWAVVSMTSGSNFPSPGETFKQALVIFG